MDLFQRVNQVFCIYVTTQYLYLVSKKNLESSNTSRVDSLDRFRITVFDKVKPYRCLLKGGYN